MLNNKKILLGISGGIAAYKCAALVRLLIKAGAEVKVVMTEDAQQFITPLTLQVLSKNIALSSFTNEAKAWNNHVDLALWADLMVIAPATANTLGKMALGICDNLLLATYFSARCKVMFAPAMDADMYVHPAIVNNISQLVKFGNVVIPATFGELASGLIGEGRMAEPETIVATVIDYFTSTQKLSDKTVLITAGPTYENIDPVRFIGNYSSGKMGVAIAEAFASMGATVHLVCGPGTVASKHNSIERHHVISATAMQQTCEQLFDQADVMVMAAAVADYRPEKFSEKKIKKEEVLQINLVKNPDILQGLGNRKKKNQVLVGFALETDNEVFYAKEKLIRKNLDLIVLNSLNDDGAGFGKETNKVSLFFANGDEKYLPLMSKHEVGKQLAEQISVLLDQKT